MVEGEGMKAEAHLSRINFPISHREREREREKCGCLRGLRNDQLQVIDDPPRGEYQGGYNHQIRPPEAAAT